ncbi:RNA-directed DNA polymerase from mobile element jockey [Araneus ventricosus]|uniref:RNA-directed DNA polymerase from mobile element jockey n=1 Tax=Araneus ventricosus TaxID=182803 RepID=A0A4Y2PGA0_ARAVE|nr:RNA-directed DNA polymerase from mobile element jockey [Araneus ventricosus]
MSFVQWNCRSLCNKRIWLHQPPFSTANFWIFQETFLKADDNLSHPNKIFFRTHRSNRPGGGLLIGIPKNISGRVIYSIDNDPNLEVLAVEIQSKNLNFIIINIYTPHGFNIASIKHFIDSLSIPTFIFGDFNLHHPLWGGSSQSSLSESFVDWLNDSDFSLLNTSAPTHISNPHTSSIIDLTLCSASIYNEIDCYVFDCTFESDHIPIVISWSKFQNTTHTIKTINWKPIIKTSIDIFNTTNQPSIDLITDQISRTISAHTANKILVDKDYPPWWNAACHNFSRLKKLAWNKARRSIATTEWIKYKEYRTKFKFHFKKAKENYWDSISQISRNPRMFFKILNKFSSHTNPNVKSHEIIFHNNRYVTNPITQSNLFANHFSSYSHEVQPIPFDYSTDNEFLNRNIEFWELKRAISKTKNSTPGADNIPSIWFKTLDDASLSKILGMLQQQLDSSVLPKVWKHTIIIPIPKPNKDKTKLTSYRPIALTSVFCKIFERILAHRITHFLTSQKKLNPNQRGFLPFRDNHTAIYKIYSAISEARKNKNFFVAVSLDIKSAYDSVHVDALILKCLQLGISGKVTKWMHHFLQERSFQIKWRNSFSNTKTSFKGLPQGSVLSPILYVIFMNDFFETLDNNVECSIFADDIFVYCSHHSLTYIQTKIQNTLELIYKWCCYWKLTICPEKSAIIELSNKQVTSFPSITYAGIPLPWSESIKYLGIQLSKYNQNGQILRSLRNKALKKINGLKMLGYKRNGPRTKHLITITNNSILSLFFYSSPIINKFSETHLKSCNVIQTTSLRIALGVPTWTPNIILLKLAGQEILSGKIKRLAIQFFIKQLATQPFSALFHTPDRIHSQLVEKDAESLRITFRNLNCIPDHIISLPIFPHSNPNACEIFLKDFYFQNKELPSSIISSDFIDCIQRLFPNHFIIATDGSKSHCRTSIAGFSCLQQFCYRIHPLNSVFTAEVLAICQALDELVIPEKDILILSDSFSALSSLKNISFHSPKVIQRLAAKIHIRKNLNQNIALMWVPGHSGVSWNEKADSIAKQVSDSSPYIDWIASEDILSHLKQQSFQITEENYHKSKYQLLIGNFPDILTISKWTGNRVQDRLIARIISKTITTPGLLSRFNLHPDPLCRVYNEINDISHILLRCQKYAFVRVTLWRKLNIASANITYDVLLSHVLVNKNKLLIFIQTLKYFDID